MGTPEAGLRGLQRLGTLPAVTAALTLVGALYYTLVAFGNITDYGTNRAFVEHVFNMRDTFGDPDLTWRAIDSPTVQTVAYWLIIIWEAATAAVLIWALVAWVSALARGGDHARARRLSTLGWLMAILLFAGGFIAIGGEWFAMWQSKTWNGQAAALQNVIIAGLAVIITNLRSDPT